ncbi:sulfite exporter TauE/SafE family protein [Elizabethkingia anophelis]|uniref:sulfite exporter TauE/SafE family protein n=1 Tax=Elizabethkingia anophelis TaxID=1117645 RepID=UPI0012B1F99A|nr:sulfite exporter TauE/SafE family protein [Elizabethkingia anophelis]QGN24315.1 TSUP family transporter [Elizabethkingia anophelis]QNV10956.1 sulfite exporter TauE/SafE family protein [Elizabethkingia anophelis]UTF89109.1 sulfite exporter TauE/SafE family protein [Elizabethkingia anophelis]UTG00031.1 sulfite exporter TauE/SafE family protein [Elizabethkingia anophelis]UTG03746.1 sulfite exporter TauE/SafE family protein [Elizabethkingia anophelis]
MDIAGYLASIFIGIALGLIGGGGSILTVPVLVYLFRIDAVLATAYSLFIVGTTSVVGSFSYFKKGLVNIRTAVVFGIPSIISVFLTRAYVVPAIPQEIFSIGNFTVTKSILLMLLFAVLMIFASYSMIKKDKRTCDETSQKQQFNYPLILVEGTVVGILTGLVGAGGGFLIIPALVVLSKLPMKEAVGTSLVIIAAKSLIGFFGENGDTVIDWIFLSKVIAFALIGIFIGMALSKSINGAKLKPAFGWFVLVMGIYIIIKETVLN